MTLNDVLSVEASGYAVVVKDMTECLHDGQGSGLGNWSRLHWGLISMNLPRVGSLICSLSSLILWNVNETLKQREKQQKGSGRRKVMLNRWSSLWGNWCFMRANNPSHSEWWW